MILFRKGVNEMNTEIEKYFKPNITATFINSNGKRQLVSAYDDIRIEVAKCQYKEKPMYIASIISYVSGFLNMISDDDVNNKPKLNSIRLGGSHHAVLDRAIIINGCEWQPPIYDVNKKCYTFWDDKYDVIKECFDLNYASDIVWMKFTEDGYLGVVADGFDVNFSYDNSSGRLIRVLDKTKKWNDSCVIVFPITKELLELKSRKEIETGIGNYLIAKGVPIIDYYSHNNFL